MAKTSNFKVRCISKNMVSETVDTDNEKTVAQFQVVLDDTIGMTGNLGLIYPSSNDTYTIGSYYDVSLTEGSAPAKKHEVPSTQ